MKKIFTLLSILVPSIALAQIPGEGITVTGIAQKRVIPDQAVFNLEIATSDPDVMKAKSLNDIKIKSVLDYLNANGIPQKEIRTNGVSFNEHYDDYNKPEDRKRTFRSSIRLSFTLTDLNKYDAIYTGLVNNGAVNIQHNLSYSKIVSLRDELRNEALLNARKKAETMARTLGLSLGKAFQITDSETTGYQQSNPMLQQQLNEVVLRGSAISLGEMTNSYSVRVSFSLK